MTSQKFLGIRFWCGATGQLIAAADSEGGLFTVPSAPSMAQMRRDASLMEAYQASDWAVVDGGYVALILRILFRRRFPRISGLQILQWLVVPGFRRAIPFHERRTLWVVPNEAEKLRIESYLARGEGAESLTSWYTAPFYRNPEDFNDRELSELVSEVDPDWIVLCIGGGRQEKLGHFLRNEWTKFPGTRGDAGGRKNGPVILCTGGAISFLSGGQASIPTWADRIYLGWLFRICKSPRQFLPRYWVAAYEFPRLLWDHRSRLFTQE